MALLADCLGERYITAAALSGYTGGEPRRAGCVALKAGSDALLGVALCEVLDPPSLAALAGQQYETIRAALPDVARQDTGLLKSVAVRLDARGSGVGSELAAACLGRLKEVGVARVVALAWRSGGVCFAGGILEDLGFRPVVTLFEFWREDSLVRGYDCPACGRPCRCDAVVYARVL